MNSDRAEQIRQSRERELNRAHASLPSPFTTAVVGVSFVPFWPENLLALEESWLNADVNGLRVIIVRNPSNPYDSNACEVHIPALGEDMAMVGHITKSMAARLAPELDNGTIWQGAVAGLRIHPDHLDHPGLDIRLERIVGS